MKVIVVQVSDIHIDETKDNPILSKSGQVAAAVYPYLAGADQVTLIVSGDIAYSGTEKQYELAAKFLQEIQEFLAKEAGIDVEFFIVPGNHDCNFSNEERSRVANVMLVQTEGLNGIDESVISTCTGVQKEFFAFQDRMHSSEVSRNDPLWYERRYLDDNRAVVFEGLNVSWISKKQDEPGKLYFPHERYRDKPRKSEDLHVLVMHHPVNWFNQHIYADFRRFLRERATIIISGHEHIGGVSEVNDIDTGVSIALEGRVLQEHGGSLSNTGFNVVVMNTDTGQYLVARLDYRGGSYEVREEPRWEGYRSLPAKVNEVSALKKDFAERLNDPGAHLNGGNKNNLTLNDIYVYPDLLPAKEVTASTRNYYSSSNLQAPDEISCGVLISGDERSGRTSLLYQLFSHFHAMGKMPLLLDGKEIVSTHDRDLDQLVKRVSTRQYEPSSAMAFGQASRFEKILLLDNFDDSPIIDATARIDILSKLKARFDNVIVTVSPAFEMQGVLEGDVATQLKQFRHFRLQPFGNVKRSQLIKRWCALESDGTVDEGTFIGKCHEADRLLSGVMDSSLIPHAPLYLLILLQSIQIGRSGELQNSSLGHYYNFLLTQALERAGVKPERLDEYYQYCTFLAWRFHESKSNLLNIHELRKFNDDFTNEWMTTDFDKFLDTLLEARVLQKVGQDYGFRYPYIYFYLKGRYLSRELEKKDISDYVTWCCDHLYVRDNANTILFLAHHVSNDVVLENIARVLNGLFSDKAPVELGADVAPINKLIYDAPDLVFEQSQSPAEHRDQLARRADEREAKQGRKDSMREIPENGNVLSLQAKLIMLTKTSEILGQLLKDQYARISRPKKRKLIGDIFNGNLRTLRSFFDVLVENTESLIEGIKSKLASRGKDVGTASGEAFVRRLVSTAVETITLSLIINAAKSTTSSDLAEDVAALVTEADTLSYRIIELATLLDSAKDLPRRQLEVIYKDTKDSIIARHALIYLVFNRLYMFKTSSSDINWLHKNLKLGIKFQQNLAYGRNDAKLA